MTILSPNYLKILDLPTTAIPVRSGTEVVVNTPSNVIKAKLKTVSTNQPQYKDKVSAGYTTSCR